MSRPAASSIVASGRICRRVRRVPRDERPARKALRQTVTQGLPRVVVDSGHVNVKLSFRLVDLDQFGARPNGVIVHLKSLIGSAGKDTRLKRLRLIVRQVNEDTTPTAPSAASGIGELDLTFKTV